MDDLYFHGASALDAFEVFLFLFRHDLNAFSFTFRTGRACYQYFQKVSFAF